MSKPVRFGIAAIALVALTFAFVVWKQEPHNAAFVHQKCSIITSHNARDFCDWLSPVLT